MAYNALSKRTILVHEMGHFLSLDHPWEMNEIDKDLMGLHTHDEIQENHMAYGLKVNHFTDEQLERMLHFALEFRSYLIDRTEYSLRSKVTEIEN